MDRKLIGMAAAAFAVIAAAALFLTLREGPAPRRADPGPEQPSASAHEPNAPVEFEPAAGSTPSTSPIRPAALVNRTGIAGRVVDEEGAPIVGATVTAGDAPPVITDHGGGFEVADIEGATCDVLAEASGFAFRVLRGVKLAEGRQVEVTIALPARPERIGRVIGPAGEPVAGAAVAIRFQRFGVYDPESHDRGLTRTTNDQGWFSFTPCRERLTVVEIRARKDGVGEGILNTAMFNNPADFLVVRLQTAPLLEPRSGGAIFRQPSSGAPGIVEGRVTDASGRGVAGALIRAEHPSRGIETRADDDGRYRLLGVSPFGLCRVGAARDRGPPTWSKHFALEPGETKAGVDLELSSFPDLVVDVVGVDGRPAPGITVTVDDEETSDGQLTRVTARTDAAGRAAFEDVPSTRVRVGVDPASLPPGVGVDQDDNYSVGLLIRREAPVVVRLRPEVVFRGQVVLEDGTPAGSGTIAFRSPEVPRPAQPMKTEPLFNFQAAPAERYRDVERYARASDRGDFTLRVRSLDVWEFGTLTRILRPPGAPPELQIFEPVARRPLAADRPNVIVVRRKG